MESTVLNLKKIRDLSVVSRTSAEKYRNTSRSMLEVAKELNVNYVIEGSGQKIGDRIVLNIQLIEARTDKHLWSKQYRRETKEIFDLQEEIAKNIAEEIQAIITPEEEERIEKKYTDDPVAYDYFLKGKDLFYQSTKESLEQSIPWFKKAIEQDQKFVLPYANAAMVFYYLDVFQPEKKYSIEIGSYADRAFSLDGSLEESLLAKGLSHTHKREFQQALPYFEKALEQNPGSGLVLHFLTEFYSIHVPDAGMYLKYALKGVSADVASSDSVTVSFRYLQLGNALVEAGFVDEAVTYIKKSLDHNPNNFLARPLSVYITYARNKDLKQMRDFLEKEYSKDSSRLDLPMQLGLACYLMRDHKAALRYYEKFNTLRDVQPFDYFRKENLKIGNVLAKTGYRERSEKYLRSFKDFADQDQSKDKHWYLGMYYAYRGDKKKALEELNLFSKEESCKYWILLFDKQDPVFDSLKENPEFKKVMNKIESDFWANHKKIRESLEEKELI